MKICSKLCFLLAGLTLWCAPLLHAQQYVTTVGIQFKPIIPSVFFRKDGYSSTTPFYDGLKGQSGTLKVDMAARNGTSIGMVVRRGLNKRFSFEGGINMITRNYTLNASVNDTLNWQSDLKWITYEIPLQLLVFVQLGEKTYLNAAGGMAINFFPTDIQSQDEDANYYQRTYRYRWISPNLIANVGFEYRTVSSGYFYIGASYLQPFQNMALTDFRYLAAVPDARAFNNLRGNYLTLDLRYFFHENPKSVTRKKLRDYKKSLEKK
ncbi:MAG: hypothetical protein V4616_10070 [Bacteroidota bacterium]